MERSTSIRSNAPKRNKSLVRPERDRNDPNNRLYHYRQRAAHPEQNPPRQRGTSILGREEDKPEPTTIDEPKKYCNPWQTYCKILTFFIPKQILRCAGIPDGPAQQAWREKIGLVSFILFIMGCVGFLTFGFTQSVCPTPPLSVRGGQVSPGYLIIDGWAYMLASWDHPVIGNVLYPPTNAGGMDATFLFQSVQADCASVFTSDQQIYFPCQLFNPNSTIPPDVSQFDNRTSCHLSSAARNMYTSFRDSGVPNTKEGLDKAARVYYNWNDITVESLLTVYNGYVLNLKLLQSLAATIQPNGLVASIKSNMSEYAGRDITMSINSKKWDQEARCLASTIRVGALDTISIGCMASDIVLYVSLFVILGVITVKFALAVLFGWFLSWKLGNFKEGTSYTARMKRDAEIENWSKRKSIFPQSSRFTQPLHGSTRYDNSSTLWRAPSALNLSRPSFYNTCSDTESDYTHASGPMCPLPLSRHAQRQPSPDYKPFHFTLAHTVCLVTCYSEGEAGIRTTLDSIATSDYPNSHKLMLVICDGLITGHGETQSTPEICIDMMRDLLIPAEQVQEYPYIALADGSKQNNMAKVYAGFYKYDDSTVEVSQQQRVPMITIVKCGTSTETTKPGNRGKRDSQIIFMQFMQKVMFDERMTMMEYEFFNSLWRVTGVPPDAYEIVLMVDADTKLFPDALSRLVSCAVKDPEISGLCGETKIANKTDSWVTMIQVFEYYISHHQSKAFESIFGGVTCLPGCFCMYRIKSPKGPDGYWVPILANPDIVERYSENVVDTLHKKNLLLLGEDRYLSTLMLRTFPNRKMMFVPQAVCKTVVPDTFLVLLSQRRRWINSTIHNLMELLFVHDLCGTFCFSMQFVVFMELVGTLALPAAISFTLYLIIMAILGQPALIPLILLALILGLPAVLIVMTSRKVVYVGWMLIYLFSLPIWNFVLPAYAYWHFDDFSWGDTRKVKGVQADTHADKEGEFDSSAVTMKKWREFEQDRRTKEATEKNMPIPRFASFLKKSNDYDGLFAPASCTNARYCNKGAS